MGCCRRTLAVSVVVVAGLLCYFFPDLYKDYEVPPVPDQYFGRGALLTDPLKFPKDNPEIKKFQIKVDDAVLKDLKSRLSNTRYVEPLDNVEFQYGFHSAKLKEVVSYWSTKYDWRKQEAELNKFSHFKTQIEGLDVHFVHQKPDLKGKKVRVLPLLLVHGWPGSFAEFTKILPLLTTPRADRDYVFEVICPSIPGFGFSEAPHQRGFSVASAARVFKKLMDRLGFQQFYVQGGDWGSHIVTILAKVYPDRVQGVHLNMVAVDLGIVGWTKYAVGHLLGTHVMTQAEYDHGFPFNSLIKFLLSEMGYLLIQGTKPDTVGSALVDSPAGLAAYILEKFSTWTDRNNRDLKDGGLTKKFTLDELLTNVMVYWVTNTAPSSMRFYKEYFQLVENGQKFERVPLKAPTGIAVFPNELVSFPRFVYQHRLRNIVRLTRLPRGGHFSAMEEPKLMSDELWEFVLDVEKSKKTK